MRIEIASGYIDAVEQLSSTRLRQALAEAAATAGSEEEHTIAPPPEALGIHPAVWREAAVRRLYAPLRPSTSRMHVAVMGAPGSGKSAPLGPSNASHHHHASSPRLASAALAHT